MTKHRDDRELNSSKSISQIFDDAIRIENNFERREFVSDACDHDEGMIEQIESLVRVFEKFSSEDTNSPNFFNHDLFCESLFRKSTDLAMGEVSEAPFGALEKVGDQVGPYSLKEKIGSGGFGVVYRAYQEEPLKREVAVKLIKPGMDSREVLTRFYLERQALAVMDHPSVAKIHEAGCTYSGRPYFAMELVNGLPINRYCDEFRLDLRRRVELMIKVCEGIQHAHQKGVIHRDIKPTNILVSRSNGAETPKLIDFGVAKALDRDVLQESTVTRIGQKIGTPLYMSPEQAASKTSTDVDARTDIYSLGAVLFELITGTPPLTREEIFESHEKDLFAIVGSIETPIPSHRLSKAGLDGEQIAFNRRSSIGSLVKQVGGELDWITAKSLEVERDHRYESASELANDLRRYLDGEPVEAAKPSQFYRFKKFALRNLTAFVLAATASGLLLASSAASVAFGIKATRAATAAAKAEKEERLQKNRAIKAENQQRIEKVLALKSQKQEMLAKEKVIRESKKLDLVFNKVHRLIRTAVEHDEEIRKSSFKALVDEIISYDSELSEAAKGDPSILVDYPLMWAEEFLRADDFESAAKFFEKALEVSRSQNSGTVDQRTVDVFSQLLLTKLHHVVKQFGSNTKHEELPEGPQRELLMDAVQRTELLINLEQQRPQEEARLDRAYGILALFHQELGDKESSLEASRMANEIASANENLPVSSRLLAKMKFARAMDSHDKPDEALRLREDNLEWFEDHADEFDRDDALVAKVNLLNEIGSSYRMKGMEHETIQITKSVVDSARKSQTLGESYIRFPMYLSVHADALFKAGRMYDCVEVSKETLSNIDKYRKKNWGGITKRDYLLTWAMLHDSMMKLGLTQTNQSLEPEKLDQLLSEANQTTKSSVFWRIQRAIAKKLIGDGEQVLALDRTENLLNNTSEASIQGKAKSLLALIYSELGKHQKAIDLRTNLIRQFGDDIQLDDDEIIEQANLRVSLAHDLIEIGKLEQAIPLLNDGMDLFQQLKKGDLNTRSPGRSWKAAKLLANAYSSSNQSLRALELMKQIHKQQLTLYGTETDESVDSRILIYKIHVDRGEIRKAEKEWRLVRSYFQNSIAELNKKWPTGWQPLNEQTRCLEKSWQMLEGMSATQPEVGMIEQLGKDVTQHIARMTRANIDDAEIKSELIGRSKLLLNKIQTVSDKQP